MSLVNCRFQELNLCQMYDVLRSTVITRMAVSLEDQPYVTPLHFQLEVAGTQTIFHLMCEGHGLKLHCLAANPKVCLEFEQEGVGWLDTVIARGSASPPVSEGNDPVHLRIVVTALTGRRYFRHE